MFLLVKTELVVERLPNSSVNISFSSSVVDGTSLVEISFKPCVLGKFADDYWLNSLLFPPFLSLGVCPPLNGDVVFTR